MALIEHVSGTISFVSKARGFAFAQTATKCPAQNIHISARVIAYYSECKPTLPPLTVGAAIELADVIQGTEGWIANRIVSVTPMEIPAAEWQPCVGKWFDPIKGFGFVTLDWGKQDAFLHLETARDAGPDFPYHDFADRPFEVRTCVSPRGLHVSAIRLPATKACAFGCRLGRDHDGPCAA